VATQPSRERPTARVVTDLKATGEGDILVNSSVGVIKALLSAALLDRPYLIICVVCHRGSSLVTANLVPLGVSAGHLCSC
jgi:hypothetical protein